MVSHLSMPDKELVTRAKEGDEFAYDQLVTRYRDVVFRLAYLLLGSADDAEDVAQETFIRAFRQLDQFDATRTLKPWLLQITANQSRNRYRSWRRYQYYLARLFREDTPVIASPERLTQQQIQAQELWRIVKQLKRPQQEIIYLRYFLDLSVQETSDALTIPVGTVKSRQHRALAQLKSLIESENPDLIEAFS